MGPDDGAVDHMQTVFGLSRELIEDIFEHTAFGPAIIAVITGRIGAIPFGKIAPRTTCSQDIEDPVEDPSVVHSTCAAQTLRQQRLD